MNVRHNGFFDSFFSAITWLGKGWAYAIVIIGLLFYRLLYAIIAAVSFGLTSGIVQVMKHFIFDDRMRPKGWFDPYRWEKIHLVDGVDIHSMMSFPSGHSTTIFSF